MKKEDDPPMGEEVEIIFPSSSNSSCSTLFALDESIMEIKTLIKNESQSKGINREGESHEKMTMKMYANYWTIAPLKKLGDCGRFDVYEEDVQLVALRKRFWTQDDDGKAICIHYYELEERGSSLNQEAQNVILQRKYASPPQYFAIKYRVSFKKPQDCIQQVSPAIPAVLKLVDGHAVFQLLETDEFKAESEIMRREVDGYPHCMYGYQKMTPKQVERELDRERLRGARDKNDGVFVKVKGCLKSVAALEQALLDNEERSRRGRGKGELKEGTENTDPHDDDEVAVQFNLRPRQRQLSDGEPEPGPSAILNAPAVSVSSISKQEIQNEEFCQTVVSVSDTINRKWNPKKNNKSKNKPLETKERKRPCKRDQYHTEVDGHWEISSLVDRRVRPNGIEYFVKWKGWPQKYNSWVPECDICAKQAITNYQKRRRADAFKRFERIRQLMMSTDADTFKKA